MNKTELEVVMLRKGIKTAKLAEILGINRTTLYRKLTTGKFERSEIMKIREVLDLTDEDTIRIFFDDESCVNATNGKE